jgi:hypothetical protein
MIRIMLKFALSLLARRIGAITPAEIASTHR